jgi:hypothetical protein
VSILIYFTYICTRKPNNFFSIMKKLTKNNYLTIASITLLSFGASIFLNTVEVSNKNGTGSTNIENDIQKEVEESKTKTPIITSLPGIDAAKKVITLVQKFFPTNI